MSGPDMDRVKNPIFAIETGLDPLEKRVRDSGCALRGKEYRKEALDIVKRMRTSVEKAKCATLDAEQLLSMEVEFVVASVNSRPVYAVKRHQEDGTFKWVVNDGHGSSRAALSRKLMEIIYEGMPSSEKTAEHMSDTRFDTLAEAIELARKYQAKAEAIALADAKRNAREACGKRLHSVKLVELIPSDWDGRMEPGVTKQFDIFVKTPEDKVAAEEANKKRRIIAYGYPFKIKVY